VKSKGAAKWRVILEGDLRERALASARAIVDGLEKASPASRRPASHFAEQALMHAYLGFAQWGDEHFDRSSQLLEQAIDNLATTPLRPTLYGGFVGIAWVVEHLQSHPLSQLEESAEELDPNEQVDEVLREYLSTRPWRESYDLISGLVGIGVYASERMPRAVAKECLAAVVDRLEELARPMRPGLTWWTPPEQLIEAARKEHPQGHANLGVAHGVPAAVALLARAGADGVAKEKASSLLSQSVSWFLAQELPESSESCFGYNTASDENIRSARSAWCYGDPGIAAALLCAGRWSGNEELEAKAKRIGLRAARRPVESSAVVDAPLCHGASGLAHLYNRMYQATGDETFLEGARFWFARALQMQHPGEGVGGYSAYRPNEGGWVDDVGFLSGATGIVLAMLAATTPVEPSWDRLLLASVPPISF